MRFLTTIAVLAAFFAAALPLSADNPILPGVAADPEILLSENTGKPLETIEADTERDKDMK